MHLAKEEFLKIEFDKTKRAIRNNICPHNKDYSTSEVFYKNDNKQGHRSGITMEVYDMAW